MSAKYSKSIFIFRRDLRLQDNTGLIEACKQSEVVIPVFVFDPRQTKDNQYFSANAFQFMLQSLSEVDQALQNAESRLFVFKGKKDAIIAKLIDQENIEAIFANHDYTPFAKERDEQIKKVCDGKKIEFKTYADYLLQEPATALKASDGKPYLVFTPFYKNARQIPVRKPIKFTYTNLEKKKIREALDLKQIQADYSDQKNENLRVKGGRSEAISILKSLDPNYDVGRDFPAQTTTTLLSAHHKFGTISIRETHDQLQKFYGPEHTVISELYWRDFFSHIAYHFPKVFGQAFQAKFDNLDWSGSEDEFKSWCEGRTGFPIVDAGMRELNETGYMHNRVRMITACFLVKNLHIDWRKGEQYFAQRLVDYDPAVNNGNWQWAASTGVDAQPFFRVFNPWRQQERFDKDCQYIKKWCPELNKIPNADILKWETKYLEYPNIYFAPIVEHKTSSQKTKDKYKAAHEAQK